MSAACAAPAVMIFGLMASSCRAIDRSILSYLSHASWAYIYNLPLATVFNSALTSAPLGVARACIDALTGFADSKIPVGSPQVLRDTPTVQGLIGRAEAMLRAARAFLLEATQTFWDAVETGGPTFMTARSCVWRDLMPLRPVLKLPTRCSKLVGGQRFRRAGDWRDAGETFMRCPTMRASRPPNS